MDLELQVIAEGLQFPEGPIVMADGSIILVEIKRQTLSRVTPDGQVEVIAHTGGGPNGAAIGPDGACYVCNNGGFEWHDVGGALIPGHKPHDYAGGSIQRVDLATGAVTTLIDECGGAPLLGPNDLVFDRAGGFWFSDHGKSTPDHREHGALYYVAAGGAVTCARREMLGPNGVGLSPEEDVLYVAETPTGRLWAMDMDGPGALRPGPAPWLPGRLVCTLPGFQLLDSLAVEADGKVCVGTLVNGGVTVFDLDGTATHVPFPDLAITNLCFGGPDMRDAWATGSSSGKLYQLRWPRPGLRLNFNG
jgi:gluconolactonase